MTKQERYLFYIANRNYDTYFKQGYATPGNNGPHGHKDTPVRNTSHYLIIYGYLYKKTKENKYLYICQKFGNYLVSEQRKSVSGAVQCMVQNDYDYLNGLIGQAWTIEALIYFYEIVSEEKYLEAAYRIYKSQRYDYQNHLWIKTELDGSEIGFDYSYNHNVWFAACGYKLADLCIDNEITNQIMDFLSCGTSRDFKISHKGLLKHTISLKNPSTNDKVKRIIKKILFPLRWINPRKLDSKYIEYAYHIFDIYGFLILKERFGHLDFFKSKNYLKAESLATNISWYNKKNIKKDTFNVFSYSYNSPAFELPYVLLSVKKENTQIIDYVYDINCKLMYSKETEMFTINNFDVELYNARFYEIIRYLEKR